MKGAKYILTAAVIAMSSVMMTGCFKPSKDAVVESKYYQSLKDERDKLSVQLKEEKKKTNSLNKKIKAIHAISGDQKIADYKSRVKDSRIIKVDFATNTIKNQSFAVTNIPVCKYVKKIVTGCNRMIGITPTDVAFICGAAIKRCDCTAGQPFNLSNLCRFTRKIHTIRAPFWHGNSPLTYGLHQAVPHLFLKM